MPPALVAPSVTAEVSEKPTPLRLLAMTAPAKAPEDDSVGTPLVSPELPESDVPPPFSYAARLFGSSDSWTCHGSLLTLANVLRPNLDALFCNQLMSPTRSAAIPISCMERPGGAAAGPDTCFHFWPFQEMSP